MPNLTEARIRKLKPRDKPYKAFDSAVPGLYMLVRGEKRYWRLRLTRDKQEQHVSLGVFPEVNRDQALSRAGQLRATLKETDNLDAVADLAAELRGDSSPRRRPRKPASDSLESVAKQWWAKDQTHKAAVTQTRNQRCLNYLLDRLGATTPIGAIDKQELLKVIEDIEQQHGREGAYRALWLAHAIWEYADNRGITPDIAASLRSKVVLSPPNEKPRPAITDPKQFGELLRAIDGFEGQPVTKLVLQTLARVFTRPGELRLAQWSEVRLDGAEPQLVIPKARMKMRVDDHVVPLSTQAVALFRELEQHRRNDEFDFCFPSLKPGRQLSDNTMNSALRALGYDTKTQHCAHGFRASARSLLGSIGVSPEVIKVQLAHKPPGVDARYFRAHLLEQRRPMMPPVSG